MSILGTIVSAVSSAVKAYSDANKKKNTSSSSGSKSNSSTKTTSSYKPVGSNTDAYIQQTNASDYNAIQSAKQAYADAQAIGDTAGMTNANKIANDIRAKYGYSGGSDGSEYIQVSQPKAQNPYEDAMSDLQDRYDKLSAQQQQANALAVKQGVQRLENQKYGINQAYDDSARQAYIANMQGKKNLPQQLAYSGATGGATETANLGLQTSYENNLANINMNRANALNDIDNAIVELQNNGDLNAVQQALDNSQQALSAYQNLMANKINYDVAQKENDFNRQLSTLGQYSDDYQAEINRRMELNPNDPLIPYLVAARQEKINAQKQAEANATNSAIEEQRDLAWQLFQETGIANDFIASALGIPVGTTTMDYKKNQYDINKPYYKERITNIKYPMDFADAQERIAIAETEADAINEIENLYKAKLIGAETREQLYSYNKINQQQSINTDPTYINIVNELGQTTTKEQAEQILANYIAQGLDDYYAEALLEWINSAWQ